MNSPLNSDSFDLNDLDALGLTPFDPTQHLSSKEAVAAYMSEIVATGNADLFRGDERRGACLRHGQGRGASRYHT